MSESKDMKINDDSTQLDTIEEEGYLSISMLEEKKRRIEIGNAQETNAQETSLETLKKIGDDIHQKQIIQYDNILLVTCAYKGCTNMKNEYSHFCDDHISGTGLIRKKSTIKKAGWGLFTTVQYEKGDLIGVYHGKTDI